MRKTSEDFQSFCAVAPLVLGLKELVVIALKAKESTGGYAQWRRGHDGEVAGLFTPLRLLHEGSTE